MSGFVVGFGSPNRELVENMFARIKHRGPDRYGISAVGKVIMAQNYLKADNAEGSPIPFSASGQGAIPGDRICWDGDIGNLHQLLYREGIAPGGSSAEKLMLKLYEEHGPRALDSLTDAIFTMVISDGENLFAARDLLGIKTLFFGYKDDTVYLASELKALAGLIDDVREFPAGHYMDHDGKLHGYAHLPSKPPAPALDGPDAAAANVRDIISRSLANRVDWERPTASLLSGGIDSSVIAALGAGVFRDKFGDQAQLKTFALGVGESDDLKNARLVAEWIGSNHHELVVSLDDLIEVMPSVIYQLESFDPSLVRSAASNYLISGYAKDQGVEVLLSGEGGDEVFCGYLYLKDLPEEEVFSRQIECLGFLHNNASLRLDRMNQCHGLRVVTPLISGELLAYSLSLPSGYRIFHDEQGAVEKWIFRKAYEGYLPEAITWRLKQEFSQGSGSAGVLPQYFEDQYSDQELSYIQSKHPQVRSKEELHYFKLFTGYFGDGRAVETVGQWPLL